MRKPNFFVVGAPKCGTTALYTYLNGHPNVFMPHVKEPHFFADDFSGYRYISSRDQYLRLFKGAGENHAAIGEASVFYLYSQTAIKKINAFDPAAKILVMIRNPLEMLPSLHSQLLWSCRETETDFERAWQLQAARLRGENLPRQCLAAQHLQYGEVGKFGGQVQRLLSVFPREQVKLVLFDDFTKCTRTVYEESLRFLGVEPDDRSEFPKVNGNRKHRWPALGRLLVSPPFPLNVVKQGLKDIGATKLGLTQLKRSVISANTTPTRRNPLNPRFRRELANYFNEDIALLESILQRDLSHWTSQTAPESQPVRLHSLPQRMEVGHLEPVTG
ncbi:MAG: hypothetical protein DHS20C16_18530 [Phycisphaerae bacterium]|nr:MAG: hypothetical protein DHS20C16_18530 [Phycisphaerae bacterium]